jgi:hypothetical protein
VTLAYYFPTNHLTSLEKLAKGIEVKLGCDWLAVLFSRDIRFANHEVIITLCFHFTSNTTLVLSTNQHHEIDLVPSTRQAHEPFIIIDILQESMGIYSIINLETAVNVTVALYELAHLDL